MHEYFSEKEKKVFCGKDDLHKMEGVQERIIRFIKNDFYSEYADILRDLGEDTLYLKRVRLIAQEVFKSFKGQNPESNLLGKRHATQPMRDNKRLLQLYVPTVNQIKLGYRSYTYEIPTIWNNRNLWAIQKLDWSMRWPILLV